MSGALLVLASTWAMKVWVEIPPRPAAPDAAMSAPADPDEVIVNGTRVRRLEIRVKTDRKTGVASCVLKRESGDPALDTALCREALACNIAPIKTRTLEACMSPRVGAVVRARYPGRPFTDPSVANPR